MSVGPSQFLRFLAGGAFNTSVTYALFLALSQSLSASAAYTITYVTGIGLSYLINTFLVFRSRASVRSVLQFPGVYLVQYLLGLAILALLTSLGLESRFGMLAVIAVNIPVTFLLTRWVIRGAPNRSVKPKP